MISSSTEINSRVRQLSVPYIAHWAYKSKPTAQSNATSTNLKCSDCFTVEISLLWNSYFVKRGLYDKI